MKVGILGGSFNPIHNGHIYLAKCAKKELKLDKILLIPTSDNPLKNNSYKVTKEQRFFMASLVAKREKDFLLSDIEVCKEGYSYTIDTVTTLKKENACDFTFICGADLLMEIERWKEYDKLFSILHFAISIRPPYEKKEVEERINYYRKKYNANISILQSYVSKDISSTKIRELIKENKDYSIYVPKEVYEYIKKEKLYL